MDIHMWGYEAKEVGRRESAVLLAFYSFSDGAKRAKSL
jgi:hypothetical protein